MTDDLVRLDAAITAASMSMFEDGVSPDVLEMLTHGDGRGKIAPKVLHRAIRAALKSATPAIVDELKTSVRECMVGQEWPPEDGDRQIDEVVAAVDEKGRMLAAAFGRMGQL